MKIVALEHIVPDTAYSNQDIIERVSHTSRDHLSAGEMKKLEHHLNDLFTAVSLKKRHITCEQEKPIELLKTCAEKTLKEANVKAKDLDFIIYGGVTRGFLVPSSASAIQHAIGASGVSCFDVLDACASWARAMQVAKSFIHSGMGKLGLIVNCECGAYELCNPWEIKTLDGLENRTGAFTLGEAATATLVTKNSPEAPEMEFTSKSYGEFGNLATLPILQTTHYMPLKRQTIGKVGFYTHPNDLTYAGFKLGVKLLRDLKPLKGRTVDAFIPHAGAAPSIGMFIKTTRIKHKELIMSFADYGNTVTASVPLGLSLAIKNGKINRGDTVFGATVAAGISVVSLFFEY